MSYSVIKGNADVYKIRRTGSFTWADVTIRQWVEGGSINVQSDFGSYSSSWNSIGPRDFRAFLIGLDYGYFMEKAAPASNGSRRGYRFSPERTHQSVKQFVTERRRDGEIDSGTARECWEELDELEARMLPSEPSWFVHSLLESPGLGSLFGGDPESIPVRSERCPQCAGFWTEIWPTVCDFWRGELNLEGAA